MNLGSKERSKVATYSFFILSTLAVVFNLNANEKQLIQAEKLYHERNYSDALTIYSKLFDAGFHEEVGLRLASCFLEEGEALKAIDILDILKSDPISQHRNYLLAMSYKKIGHNHQALEWFNLGGDNSRIALEKGKTLIALGDFHRAENILLSISPKDPFIYSLAQIQLSKLSLFNNNAQKALDILSNTHIDPFFNTERLFLKSCSLLKLNREPEALHSLEKILPSVMKNSTLRPILHLAMRLYLKKALASDKDEAATFFLKTEELLKHTLELESDESTHLFAIDIYLLKAKKIGDLKAYEIALQLLNHSKVFVTEEGMAEANIKRALSSPLFEERERRIDALQTHLAGRAFLLQGLNQYEEGLKENDILLFKKAAGQFQKAIDVIDDPEMLGLCYKYLSLALLKSPDFNDHLLAWEKLYSLINQPNVFSQITAAHDIITLAAWTALQTQNPIVLHSAKKMLQESQQKDISFLRLEGLICAQLGDWAAADSLFECLIKEGEITEQAEGWFWRGYCAEKQEKEEIKKEYYLKCYSQPNSLGAIAFFYTYSFKEYMHGKKKAIKHLEKMAAYFPRHPLNIISYYLVGLFYKKNDVDEQGKICRKKNLTHAIDAFNEAEVLFYSLVKENSFSQEEFNYYTLIANQSQLERAEANLTIAKHSEGSKRAIYIEYAQRVFKEIIGAFNNSQSLANSQLTHETHPYPKRWAQAMLGLAKTYEEKNAFQEADKILSLSVEAYKKAGIESGVGLMQVYDGKGSLAEKNGDYEGALKHFISAEKTVENCYQLLSPDEKISLWLKQSTCYRELKDYDSSMKILSKIINDEVISPLRIKAMILRSEIYQLQGRHELARKQLISASLKGGEWGAKAKKKLEE